MFKMNLIRLFLLLFALLACSCSTTDDNSRFKAVNGYLDLSEWNFDEQGPASLDGEWEFYQTTVNSNDQSLYSGKKDFFPLPAIWKGETKQGVPLKKHGQGTYRLKLKIGPDSAADSLYVSGMLSVCSVWINGKKVGESGIVGSGEDSEKPLKHLIYPSFTTQDGYAEIVLKVSNFHNKEGGINSSILIGSQDQIQDLINYRRISGAIIGGALLIMGIYHLVIFLMRRTSRENLYFGLFCIVWCITTVFNPPSAFLITKFFTIDWGWYIRICLLPAGLAIPLLLIFYDSLFPHKYGKKVNVIYGAIGGLYFLYILTTSPSAFSPVAFGYFLISRTAYVYLIACFLNDLRKKRKGAIYLAPGYLALAYAEFDEIFFDLNIFDSVDFAPFGIFIFILSYSLLMSARFAEALSRVEKVSDELKVRRKNEQDHKLLQLRLSKMLDSVDEALLAIDQDHVIDFSNNAFEKLTGYSSENILGQKLTTFLDEQEHGDISNLLLKILQPTVSATDETGQGNIQLLTASGSSLPVSISVHSIKIDKMTVYALTLRPQTKQPDKRQLAVLVMNSSIECWEKCTGQEKADLASSSRLWNVYFEKDGYARTQTLDRYLSEETLPLRPRWKNIHATAGFVLENCSQQAELCSELKKNLGLLKKMS